jgi:chloride channel 7
VEITCRFLLAFLVYAGANAILVMLAAMLCVYVGPSAAGSGIPEVKAYLNGVDTPNVFSLNTLFVKVIGSIGSVAGGLMVGKEGPLVHVGACIASLLGQGGSVRYGMTWKWLRYLKNDRDRRDLVTCGAAAGVAAAFRAPVGGVLFALEEVTSWYDKPGCPIL